MRGIYPVRATFDVAAAVCDLDTPMTLWKAHFGRIGRGVIVMSGAADFQILVDWCTQEVNPRLIPVISTTLNANSRTKDAFAIWQGNMHYGARRVRLFQGDFYGSLSNTFHTENPVGDAFLAIALAENEVLAGILGTGIPLAFGDDVTVNVIQSVPGPPVPLLTAQTAGIPDPAYYDYTFSMVMIGAFISSRLSSASLAAALVISRAPVSLNLQGVGGRLAAFADGDHAAVVSWPRS
jgi:hypothetical protein